MSLLTLRLLALLGTTAQCMHIAHMYVQMRIGRVLRDARALSESQLRVQEARLVAWSANPIKHRIETSKLLLAADPYQLSTMHSLNPAAFPLNHVSSTPPCSHAELEFDLLHPWQCHRRPSSVAAASASRKFAVARRAREMQWQEEEDAGRSVSGMRRRGVAGSGGASDDGALRSQSESALSDVTRKSSSSRMRGTRVAASVEVGRVNSSHRPRSQSAMAMMLRSETKHEQSQKQQPLSEAACYDEQGAQPQQPAPHIHSDMQDERRGADLPKCTDSGTGGADAVSGTAGGADDARVARKESLPRASQPQESIESINSYMQHDMVNTQHVVRRANEAGASEQGA